MAQTITTVNTYSDEEIQIIGESDFGEIDYRPGWNFVNWNTMPDGSGVSYEPGQDARFDTDTRLYAQWKKRTCIVSFDANGGSATGLSPREVDCGGEIGELPIATYPHESGFAGMKFQGWFTEGGTQVVETTIVPKNLSEITLYAHWIGVIHYQVSNNYDNNVIEIDANNVATGFKGEVSTGKYCAIKTIDKFDFTGKFKITMKGKRGDEARRQDIFAGRAEDGGANIWMDFGIDEGTPQWEIAKHPESGSTQAYPPRTYIGVGDEFTLRVVRNDENQILCYSKLNDSDEWTLDYEGEGNGYLAPGTFYIGIDPDYLSEYFAGEIYLDECYLVQENENQTNQPCGKYVLCEVGKCIVTYNPNGGEVNPTSNEVEYDSEYGELPIPEWEGHEFIGWFTTATGGTEVVSTTKVTNASDHSIFAHWNVSQYTVTFDSNGGSQVPAITREWNQPVGELPTATRNGFNFVGWFEDLEYTVAVTAERVVVEDVTFTAKWEQTTEEGPNISYNKNLSAATLPSGLMDKYTPNDILVDYTPTNIAKPANTTVCSRRSNFSNNPSYMYQESLTYGFQGWSPDKLYHGHEGNMTFDANWKKEYISYVCASASNPSYYASSYRVPEYIFAGVQSTNYLFSIADDQHLTLFHDGSNSTHGVALYFRISIRSSWTGSEIYLANIPIPPKCVYVQQNGEYTKPVSQITGGKWGDSRITTWCVSGTGTINQELSQQTVYYSFGGSSSSTSFQIQKVPIAIPTPGSPILPSTLANGATNFRYPSATGTKIMIRLVVQPNDGCDGVSLWVSRPNARPFGRLTQVSIIPVQTRVVYNDGSAINYEVSGTIEASTLGTMVKPGLEFETIRVGNDVTAIGTNTNTKWGAAKEVILTKSVKTIQANAFEGSNIVNMVVPANVTSIGDAAFKDCSNIKCLVIKSSGGSTAERLVAGCSNLRVLNVNMTKDAYKSRAATWWDGETNQPNGLEVICTDGKTTVSNDGTTVEYQDQ